MLWPVVSFIAALKATISATVRRTPGGRLLNASRMESTDLRYRTSTPVDPRNVCASFAKSGSRSASTGPIAMNVSCKSNRIGLSELATELITVASVPIPPLRCPALTTLFASARNCTAASLASPPIEFSAGCAAFINWMIACLPRPDALMVCWNAPERPTSPFISRSGPPCAFKAENTPMMPCPKFLATVMVWFIRVSSVRNTPAS
jgi:hypothetical protein